MKRRYFAQSLLLVLGTSNLPVGTSMAVSSIKDELQSESAKKITTEDGLILKLEGVVNPTSNKDHKQFILTYNVDDFNQPLEDKIYRLSVDGHTHDVYMTPVNDRQLQAVFNRRINA